MKEELDKKLCEKYPKIFRDRHGDMRQTLMCWGFDVGDGWYNIIDTLCAVIQNHIDNSIDQRKWALDYNAMVEAAKAGDYSLFDDKYKSYNDEWREREKQSLSLREVPEEVHQVVAVQVKEKFGGLRFYVNGGDDFTYGATCYAESLSYRTCEECGAPGKTRGPGWIVTLCEEHAKVHKKHTDAALARIREQHQLNLSNKEIENGEFMPDGHGHTWTGVLTDEALAKVLENRKLHPELDLSDQGSDDDFIDSDLFD